MQNQAPQSQEKPTSLLDVIPGYREAIAAEAEIREGAFLEAPEFICGVEVKALTLLHVLRLSAIRSQFVGKGKLNAAYYAAIYVWALSPQYEAALCARKRIEPWAPRLAQWLFNRVRRRFVRRLRRLSYVKLLQGIKAYSDEAHQDGPESVKGEGFAPSYYSGPTGVVARLAREFHWSEADVLNMPLKRLFQYTRWLTLQNDSKAVLFNPSDKVRGEFLKSQTRN